MFAIPPRDGADSPWPIFERLLNTSGEAVLSPTQRRTGTLAFSRDPDVRADHMAAGLAGSARVRRHPRHCP